MHLEFLKKPEILRIPKVNGISHYTYCKIMNLDKIPDPYDRTQVLFEAIINEARDTAQGVLKKPPQSFSMKTTSHEHERRGEKGSGHPAVGPVWARHRNFIPSYAQ